MLHKWQCQHQPPDWMLETEQCSRGQQGSSPGLGRPSVPKHPLSACFVRLQTLAEGGNGEKGNNGPAAVVHPVSCSQDGTQTRWRGRRARWHGRRGGRGDHAPMAQCCGTKDRLEPAPP